MSKPLFKLEVADERGIGWSYTVWYKGDNPLTDVSIRVDEHEIGVYNVQAKQVEPVARWLRYIKTAVIVDVQWNGRHEVIRVPDAPQCTGSFGHAHLPNNCATCDSENVAVCKASLLQNLKNQIFTDRVYVTFLLYKNQFSLDGKLKTQIRKIYRKHADAKSDYTLGEYGFRVKLPLAEILVFKKDLISILEGHVNQLIKRKQKQ